MPGRGRWQVRGEPGVTANVIRANGDPNTHLLLSERYSIAKKPSRPEQELVFEGPNDVRSSATRTPFLVSGRCTFAKLGSRSLSADLVVSLSVENVSTGGDIGVNFFDPPTVGASDNTSFIADDGTGPRSWTLTISGARDSRRNIRGACCSGIFQTAARVRNGTSSGRLFAPDVFTEELVVVLHHRQHLLGLALEPLIGIRNRHAPIKLAMLDQRRRLRLLSVFP